MTQQTISFPSNAQNFRDIIVSRCIVKKNCQVGKIANKNSKLLWIYTEISLFPYYLFTNFLLDKEEHSTKAIWYKEKGNKDNDRNFVLFHAYKEGENLGITSS